MIDFSKIDERFHYTRENILSHLTEEQIFFLYFGPFELGKAYPSKLRRDGKPSTGFFIHRLTGAILYSDFTTGEKLNCFQFVAKLHNLSGKDALRRIAKDFGLVRGEISSYAKDILNQSIQFDRNYKKDTQIQFVPGRWTTERLAYFAKRELTKQDIENDGEVFAVDRLFVNKVEYKVDHLCFAYITSETIEGKTTVYTKIYQPYSTHMKWLSNIPITVPFGINTLKYGSDKILIGKAKKEELILKKLFPSVISSQNESEAALTNKLIRHLTFNFPQRIIAWDADDAGVTNCKKFNEKGFGYFNTPRAELANGIKDIDEYVVAYKLLELEKLFKRKGLL